MRGARAAFAVALLAAAAAPAGAHRLAPSLLELQEKGGGLVEARFKTPRWRAAGSAVEPVWPEGCEATAAPSVEADASARTLRVTLQCTAPLVGARVAVRGLERSGTDALVHVVLADGRRMRRLLTAAGPELVVPPRDRAARVLRDYGGLGVRHLLGGWDHLLFVWGLVALARGRRLLAAVTAFTAGHSVTLALAATGWARAPAAAVELGIAGSLVLLAAEVGRRHTASPGPVARHAAALPFALGLLHGMGFAGALRDLGLPEEAVPLALFAFNAGIELAQLAVVAALLAAERALRPLLRRRADLGARLPATAIGALGVAALWWRAAILLAPDAP